LSHKTGKKQLSQMKTPGSVSQKGDTRVTILVKDRKDWYIFTKKTELKSTMKEPKNLRGEAKGMV